jgi:hypothetical protein
MLLKRPESGPNSSLKGKKIRNVTLVICLLIILFFAARLLLIYDKAKTSSVIANLVGGNGSAINPPASISTPSTSPVNVSSTVLNSTNPTTSIPTTPISYPPAVAAGHEVGIAMGSQLTGLTAANLETEVSGLQALGIKLVRFDIDWGFVQQGSVNNYDWSKYDLIINSLNAHGIQGIGIIDNTPPWARTPGCGGGAHCPPNNPAQFATFAAAVVTRYKSKGMHDWEIWNEENDYDFWATKSDCVAYTALLKAVYPAIKKADPSATVITGGLAQISTTNVNTAPLTFLQCIYNNGGEGSFDAVGYHPYTFPQFPSDTNAWASMDITNPSVRSIMTANGDANKKVWITEFGTPTNGPDPAWYVSEAQQSQMLTTTINLYQSYNWVH